ncbi:MAG: hypothetical protein Kow0079_09860 [Vicingaceae bacterium]
MKQFVKLLLVLSWFLTNQINAQNTKIAIDSKAYQALKAKGEISIIPDEVFHKAFLNSLTPYSAREIGVKGDLPPGGSINASAGCDCYQPHDNTYTLALAANDDGSTASIPLPFNFCFYGNTITSFYINNNGNISFGSPYSTFTASGFPSSSFSMIAPFWGDVDTRGAGSGLVWYKITPTALYVVWENVGYFNSQTDKLNSFSLIITDGNDPVIGVGNNVAFCYGDMNWTTGSASGGAGGFGGTPATVGANQGNGVDYIQFGRFDQPGTAYDGPFNNNDGVDYLDNISYTFNVCSSNNIPPIPVGINLCDTLRLCVGDSLPINLSMLSPEAGQNTTISYDTTGVGNFNIVNITSGNTATFDAVFTPDTTNLGVNIITITAWDNGAPPDTVNFNIIIYVDSLAFYPVITGDTLVCNGDSVLLDAGAGFDSYSWTTGSSNQTTYATPGSHAVTITLNGCRFTTPPYNVYGIPNPKPTITGNLHYCNDDSTMLSVTQTYDSYLWNNGDTLPSIQSGTGTVIVQVTDTNGCKGWDTVLVTSSSPQTSILGVTGFCPGQTITITASGNHDSYLWNTGDTTSSITIGQGTYFVTVSDTFNCSNSDTVVVQAWPQPNASFVIDPSPNGSPNTTITFTDQSTIGGNDTIVGWSWTFGDTTANVTTQNATHTYNNQGTYTVTLIVVSNNGCADTVSIDYLVVGDLIIPNVFTPNGDGINDVLEFTNLEFYGSNHLVIYNRWGNKLYEKEDYQNDWDGGNHPEGTYYFILKVEGMDEPIKGSFTMLK